MITVMQLSGWIGDVIIEFKRLSFSVLVIICCGIGCCVAISTGHFVGVHLIAVIGGPALRIWHCVVNIVMDVPQAVDVNAMCDEGAGVMAAVNFGDVADITKNDILRKVFRSKDDAYEFYKKLGKFYGFGIRRGDMFKDEKCNLVRRRFFCNREGQRDKKHYNRIDRKRPHKPETRTNCEARMCIYLDKESSLWRVKKIILNHNHDMIHPGMVHLITSFCSMTDAAKAQLDGF
ncbi:hypothetical protein Ahy_B02g059862 [Arachis hypogaea]|uniref:FAR1 domain-containing protein n=1 Tax=Arachis hypogaea TaxID=3818 RepID=A0A445AHI5_ARAHY|nr:hypothetical protein Ahy_B02g059862 [Arachis hypogaea]